jgi:dipeptidyl aminopeptidase/acylaminoacyl peptidase
MGVVSVNASNIIPRKSSFLDNNKAIMKKLLLYLILMQSIITSNAQKALITDTTYKSWTEVGNGILNDNGKYAMYTVRNKPVGGNTLVVTSTDKSWQREYTTLINANFSKDGKYLFAMQKDTLIKFKLGLKEITHTPHCTNYELYSSPSNDWLIYQLDSLSILKVNNLRTGQEVLFQNIAGYIINRNAESLILQTRENNSKIEILQLFNLISGVKKDIYKGDFTSDLIFDISGQRIAFTTLVEREKKIWYYDKTLSKAEQYTNAQTKGIREDCQISTDAIWSFSTDGKGLFFTQTLKTPGRPVSNNPKIWNYQDAYLLPNYESDIIGKSSILNGTNLSILRIKEKKVVQLLSGLQKIKNALSDYKSTDILIIESTSARTDELPWNSFSKLSYYLCYTKTGELKILKKDLGFALNKIQFSPDGHYILYYNSDRHSYVSYNMDSQQEKILGMPANSTFYQHSASYRGDANSFIAGTGIAAWIENTHRVIIQGTYDLWEFDLDDKVSPVNLTEGKGGEEKIVFALALTGSNIISPNERHLVKGFSLEDKSCSIYQLNLREKRIKQIFRTDRAFDRPYDGGNGFFQQSKNGHGYLLRLGEGSELINYSYTADFKNIISISNNQPDKKYNWMETELMHYQDEFGQPCEAILYKPRNFDSEKKYPVIFQYYMELGDELHNYVSPSPSNIGFNIPVLVSHGYLVCRPNIYRIQDQPGVAALVSVKAAANYLSKFDWVDSSKLALAGHSLGGFETNYIVTHSRKFKAALSCAGLTNMLNNYNDIFAGGLGISKQGYVKSMYQMIHDVNELPIQYVNNSPIFNASAITLPLLIMHNEGDENVSATESKRFFVQLRSFKKPVWLVQYDQEKHTLTNEKNQIDFQDKVLSFFDTYLKNKPMPNWMKNPIQPPFTN